ncbi:MAG: exosortase/archaeosortase family protein [Verrucomicrobia bacterium]|nr:exosortase/archaeosortase family protein [Verrucomicrobiota bacterium]
MEVADTRIWNERWRLAALTVDDLIKIGLMSIIVGLAFIMWHYQGNTTDIVAYGRSAFLWVGSRWTRGDGNFSHGWLIFPVGLGLVWWKRRDLAVAPKEVSKLGLALVVCALLLHWLGAKSTRTRVSLLALILLIWSIPFYFYGWKTAKLIIFPCAYLIFCIPLNFLDSLTFPLRILATIISTSTLNGLGIAAERSGSAIYSLAAGGFSFDVADPCSGLRSLLAMTALTAVYAYVTQKTLVKKWLLFLASIPLAIVGNIARITTVALVAEAFGEKVALGLYHDYSGYVVFSVAIGLMVGVGSLLNVNYRELMHQWKQAHTSPILSS